MSSITKLEGDIIGLDLGMSRTGVARLNTVARIAEPLEEITMAGELNFVDQVLQTINEFDACALIVGLPRGLDGQETDQTKWSREQTEQLKAQLKIPVYSIDEAGSTKRAEEIARYGQSVDSVAAGVFLEDFAQAVTDGRLDDVTF